jgi:hypothetical protein
MAGIGHYQPLRITLVERLLSARRSGRSVLRSLVLLLQSFHLLDMLSKSAAL